MGEAAAGGWVSHTHTQGDLGTGPGLKFCVKAGAWASSSRLPWDSPFSIIKPRVAEASMNLESVRNHLFYCAKLIEASSRRYRGFRKLFVLQYKTHRGFFEASSRLSKTIGFTIQNSSRLHRGFQVNQSLDVEDLCKGFPKRVQMVHAAEGNRISK